MKSGFLDKLIERLAKLDPESLQLQFLRLIQEKGLDGKLPSSGLGTKPVNVQPLEKIFRRRLPFI